MYEVDFLPVESENGPGSKSGDAIAIHFKLDATGEDMVVVIDGGFTAVGDDLADHIERSYKTSYVDLVISTHPDADHINGIARLLERLTVKELFLHQPILHCSDASDFSNIEAIENLLKVAEERGVIVTEPFTGLTRFNDQLRILGPTGDYYRELIEQHIEEMRTGSASRDGGVGTRVMKFAASLLERTLSYFPIETLTDEGDTGPRNNSSVITLLQVDGRRLLFTGDAGIPALEAAADAYEEEIGSFAEFPLRFVQIPHHGSKRNVGPTILDRILGSKGHSYADIITAYASSAKADEKHPSPKVLNAFGRRGCKVSASEGKGIRHGNNPPAREGWSALTPLPPLDENDYD